MKTDVATLIAATPWKFAMSECEDAQAVLKKAGLHNLSRRCADAVTFRKENPCLWTKGAKTATV